MHKKPNQNESIFFYLLTLTAFFLLLEIGFFIQCTQFYFDDFNFVSKQLHVPSAVWRDMAIFAILQLSLHLLCCIVAWLATLAVIQIFHVKREKQLACGIGIWSLEIITVLVANQYFFPNSKFAELIGVILFHPWLTKVMLVLTLSLSFAVLLLMFAWFCRKIPRINRLTSAFVLLLAIVPLTWLTVYSSNKQIGANTATAARPNIIIVGVDSLRPDFLNRDTINTPFMDAFLKQATVFGEAVTPLARTFPSWTSILTGQYPREVNVRSNLAEQQHAKLNESLPAILKEQGYYTIYATDETRFSNISKAFGFDELVTPPVGLSDFLIGTFNDFPLSNLIVNTRLGKMLFPFSYANRPVHFTYDPNSFLTLMQPTLQKHYQQPVMLAVHFCLPHSPYMWSSFAADHLTPLERYEKSIERVDQQLRDFFVLLKQNHFLDHAIVVMLSDHGEALELNGDRITDKALYVGKQTHAPKFYPPSLESEDWNQSAGHGTDVLGLTQYQTLLAFRLYGASAQVAGVIPGVVSMTEIKPAILQLLGLPVKLSANRSLADIIQGKPFLALPFTHIFLESDYSPESIRTVYPETKKVVLEGVHLFQIDQLTTRLTVKPTMAQMIIQSKQYADIYGEWMLALYPQDQYTQLPILVNLRTGEWTEDLHSTFAKQSPATNMLTALKRFYGQEIIQ